jgi:hypothetical protein
MLLYNMSEDEHNDEDYDYGSDMGDTSFSHDIAEKMGLHEIEKLNNITENLEARLKIVEDKQNNIKGGKTKKHKRNPRRKTNKRVKSRKNRGKGPEWKTTPITDKKELQGLEEADRNAAKRQLNNNKMKGFYADLDIQRNNIQRGFTVTPMDPKEIQRQQREDDMHNKRVNSKKAKSKKLSIYDLGGAKSKRRKHYINRNIKVSNNKW